MEPPGDIRRIVLVGFMAAGKSTVAPRLAQVLGWRVFDVDQEITRRTGQTVAEIFRDRGEAHFRELESELTAELCSGEAVVIAPGGGWITSPSSAVVLQDPATRSVWLRVSAEEALRRSRQQGIERPLLGQQDPLKVAGQLLAEREPLYASADLVIDVDGMSADAVVDDILTWLKTSIS